MREVVLVSRRARRLEIVGAAAAVLVALVVVLNLLGVPVRPPFWPAGPQGSNPFAGTALHVVPDSQAALAARSASPADAAVLDRLAATPTAAWLTPEALPVEQVGDHVRRLTLEARDADAVAVLVLYGIADRDCTGQESAGGLPAERYPDWVRASADGADGIGHLAVVVEPDALAALDECPDPDGRVELLRGAVRSFVDAGVPTYVDAGHSDWVPAEEMARRLRLVGVEDARGFAVNVSSYGSEDAELAYARAVSAAADDAAFVVDTGRNGTGGTGEWCNPAGRALGALPAAADDEGSLDARLWIKPPGESDGTCGGGPPAGQWWTERALELARAAGW